MPKRTRLAAILVVGLSAAGCHESSTKASRDGGDGPSQDADQAVKPDAAIEVDASPTPDGSAEEGGMPDGCQAGPLADFDTLTDPLSPPQDSGVAAPPIAFGAAVVWESDERPETVCVVKHMQSLNGDARDDLVLRCSDVTTGSDCQGISNGDGTFSVESCGPTYRPNPPGIPPPPPPPEGFHADFDGDGKTEFKPASSDRRCGWTSSLLLSSQGQAQTAPIEHLVDRRDFGAAEEYATDVDADGRADLLMIRRARQSVTTIYVAHGRGDGTFDAPLRTAAPASGLSVLALIDVNGDGGSDLVEHSVLSDQLITSVMLSRLDGTFASPVSGSTPGTLPASSDVEYADFNGDGRFDLLVYEHIGTPPRWPTDFWFVAARGDGTFDTPTHEAGSKEFSHFIGDFNGDGKADFLTSSGFPSFWRTFTRFAL